MVWTGTKGIVFGGYLPDGNQMVTASSNAYAFDPTMNAWTQLSSAPVGLAEHVAVWTGSQMLVWGGAQGVRFDTTNLNWENSNFWSYDPQADAWQIIVSPSGGPSWRNYESAVWTGSEMIIWGGGSFFTQYHTGNCLNDGYRFDPFANIWTKMSMVNAPSPRCGHVAVWTGTEMIVWGGYAPGAAGNPVSPYTNQPVGTLLYDGAVYNPTTDTWTPIPISNIAISSQAQGGSDVEPLGVWDGQELIVWTGNGGQAYSLKSGTWSTLADMDGVQTWRGNAIWDGHQVAIFTTGMWSIQSPGGQSGWLFNPFQN
jgi:hypothetical protein